MREFLNTLLGKIILWVISFVVIWLILDVIDARLIAHEAFQFSLYDRIVKPAIYGVLVAVILHYTGKKKKEK